MMARVSASPGIPTDAMAFYAELAAAGFDKQWWAANKARYEASVREPLAALLDALEDEFGPARMFRPYRDTRFSADKTPYKDHQAGLVELSTGLGYYLQVSADGLMTGGGIMHLSSEQLARYRAAVEGAPGEQLAALVTSLRRKGFQIGGDVMKTRPRGVPEDHPRVELLRHRSLIAWRDHGTPAWLSTSAAARKVRDDWRAIRPTCEWLQAQLG